MKHREGGFNMRKILLILICVVLCVSLCSCGRNKGDSGKVEESAAFTQKTDEPSEPNDDSEAVFDAQSAAPAENPAITSGDNEVTFDDWFIDETTSSKIDSGTTVTQSEIRDDAEATPLESSVPEDTMTEFGEGAHESEWSPMH